MIECVAKGEIVRVKRKAHSIGRWFSKWPVWVYRLHQLAHSLGGVAFRPVETNVEAKW
jgi:hypothetical protein